MSRKPKDPRVTDLARYKQAREAAKRRPPPKPPSEGLLGSRPRAGLILALILFAVLVMTAVQFIQH